MCQQWLLVEDGVIHEENKQISVCICSYSF